MQRNKQRNLFRDKGHSNITQNFWFIDPTSFNEIFMFFPLYKTRNRYKILDPLKRYAISEWPFIYFPYGHSHNIKQLWKLTSFVCCCILFGYLQLFFQLLLQKFHFLFQQTFRVHNFINRFFRGNFFVLFLWEHFLQETHFYCFFLFFNSKTDTNSSSILMPSRSLRNSIWKWIE